MHFLIIWYPLSVQCLHKLVQLKMRWVDWTIESYSRKSLLFSISLILILIFLSFHCVLWIKSTVIKNNVRLILVLHFSPGLTAPFHFLFSKLCQVSALCCCFLEHVFNNSVVRKIVSKAICPYVCKFFHFSFLI